MRSFTIAHISDLHLDGVGSRSTAIDALLGALQQQMQRMPQAPVRILLITGDLVESPSASAFKEAKDVVERFRALSEFTDVRVIAGNHDVKLKGLLGKGLFEKNDPFYSTFDAPQSASNYYYREAGLDLVLLDSNGASFAKGAIAGDKYDVMVANSAKLSVALRAEINRSQGGTHRGPEDAIVRILALHHHPLPIAGGEGTTVLGVPDEPFMYLVSPATFLEAALSLDAVLILHGHRHVHGLTRYSVPNRNATTSEIEEEFWRTLYVLSCPSSTGKDCDAGFNIVQFRSRPRFGREHYNFEVYRYTRLRNAGSFEHLDPRTVTFLPLSRDYHRDIAFQVEIELSRSEILSREDLVRLAHRLLTRRAFYNVQEMSWAHAFYAYLVTHHVWTNSLVPYFDAAEVLSRDRVTVRKISSQLWALVELVSKVLGLNGYDLDEFRKKSLLDQGRIMAALPRNPVEGYSVQQADDQRVTRIRNIDHLVGTMGERLGLAARPPDGLVD